MKGPSGCKSPPVFLDVYCDLIEAIILLNVSIECFIPLQLEVLFVLDKVYDSVDPLASSFQFLYDSHCGLEIRLQKQTFDHNFLLRFGCVVELVHEFGDHRVSLLDSLAVVFTEESGDGHLQAFGGEFEVHHKLLEVYEIGLDDVGLCAVLYHVLSKGSRYLLDFAHTDHGIG